MAQTAKMATYKGRTYKLLFLGQTKFGRRAKLGFTDGSKEFWVPADDVTEGGGADRQASGPTCCECGRPGRLVRDLEDGGMKHYRCCDIPPQ